MRVIVATSTDRAIAAVSDMAARFNWEPVYWLAAHGNASAIAARFPNAHVHDYIRSIKGVGVAPFADGAYGEVDLDFWRANASQFHFALQMLERNDSVAKDMGVKERADFVYRVSAYWTRVLRRVQPALIVFEEEPHQASDYLLYLLARSLGVRVLMPIRTMPSWGFLAAEHFEDGPLIQSEGGAVPEFIQKSLAILSGGYAGARKVMLWDQLSALERSGLLVLAKRRVSAARKSLRNLPRYSANFRSFHSDQKTKGRLFSASEMTYSRFLVSKVQTVWKKRSNRRVYDSLAAKQGLLGPFVYFALGYQPEKSTSPCGDEFVNQLLAIRTVANALPEGWRLLVKEHPSQFVAQYSRYGETFRTRDYYETICRFPNTSLVPMSIDPYQLIDRSQAVASVGGSVCFEAAVRGRRALLFGHAWYSGCPGISKVVSVADVRAALELQPQSDIPAEARLQNYLSRVSASVYRSPAGRSDASLFEPGAAAAEYLRFYREQHLRMFGGMP